MQTLHDFKHLIRTMQMSHLYKPIMLQAVLKRDGRATKEQIAADIVSRDVLQHEHYRRNVIDKQPGWRLERDGALVKEGAARRRMNQSGPTRQRDAGRPTLTPCPGTRPRARMGRAPRSIFDAPTEADRYAAPSRASSSASSAIEAAQSRQVQKCLSIGFLTKEGLPLRCREVPRNILLRLGNQIRSPPQYYLRRSLTGCHSQPPTVRVEVESCNSRIKSHLHLFTAIFRTPDPYRSI
jgi:hypothetical protein